MDINKIIKALQSLGIKHEIRKIRLPKRAIRRIEHLLSLGKAVAVNRGGDQREVIVFDMDNYKNRAKRMAKVHKFRKQKDTVTTGGEL